MNPILDRLTTRLRQTLTRVRTPRKAPPDWLQLAAPQLQALFDASEIGMAITQDRQCEVISQNRSMAQMLGPAGADRPEMTLLHQGTRARSSAGAAAARGSAGRSGGGDGAGNRH